ncbi:MAG: PocR ligand-binding domain-containing protein [Candidatus Omnitrophica bacterium]|jgi:ligand-binding sensor protein/putative methionine-R-sulfoxide reductase with GAF domain|nr:PocR ligand-binding domain-containing protein [Candidatus Omnitrophota bacterium]
MSSKFKEIVDIDKWQAIQDHFSEVLRVNLRTLDSQGTLITKPSQKVSLCDELIKKSKTAEKICNCHIGFLGRLERDWKEEHNCPAGVYSFFIPLQMKQETLATLVVGPVILGKRKEENAYREIAARFSLDINEFLDALRQIRVFSFYGIKSVIELLYDIGNYICELSYQNIVLEGIVPGMTGIFSSVHNFYIDKLLDALLEVSFNFTGAERGSIMLFDKSQKELYVKISRGLKQEIVAQARSKVGEGIAGIIAQENKPFFINEKITDERIRSQLKNPQIKHSIGIPIKVNNKTLGVLNLGTSKDGSDKFTSESIETVDRLRQLVETTLGSISIADNPQAA